MHNLENKKKGVFVDVIEQLKHHIAHSSSQYPHHIIKQILKQREHVASKLLDMLEEFVSSSQRDIRHEKWLEGVTALFILAKLREPRAFPYAIRICTLPHHTAEVVLGDLDIHGIPEILASICNGDSKALCEIVANQNLYRGVRLAALKAIIILYAHNIITRQEILDILDYLFKELYEDFSDIPTMLVGACCDIHATELFEHIKKYFINDVVDSDEISFPDVKEAFARSKSETIETLACPDFSFINNLEEHMGWLFRPEDDDEKNEEDFYDCDDEDEPSEERCNDKSCPYNSNGKCKKSNTTDSTDVNC
jgi:hypothetical protein